jgi:hypothetical protein
MRASREAGLVTAVLLLLFNALPAAAVPFDTNLIVNPGAEEGTGASSLTTIVPVPGWSGFGSAGTAIQYGIEGAPDPNNPDHVIPPNPGKNLFSGGPLPGSTVLAQFIPLGDPNDPNDAPVLQLIDGGKASFKFSGFLGGFGTVQDNTKVAALFLGDDPNSTSFIALGATFLEPVLPADRGDQTGLFLRSTQQVQVFTDPNDVFDPNGPAETIPEGARALVIQIVFDPAQAFLDNLDFQILSPEPTVAPIPTPFLLVGLGAVGVGAHRLWRRLKGRRPPRRS